MALPQFLYDVTRGVEESALVLRARHEAAIASTEDAVAISCNQVVRPIQQRDRQDPEQCGRSPWPSKQRQDEDGSAGFGELRRHFASVVHDHDSGIQVARKATKSSQLVCGRSALKGREMEHTQPVMLEDVSNQTVTQPARAVVKHQMSADLNS
jgi:hypothetical protein